LKIIFLTHHPGFRGYSMTRYTQFLYNGFKKRGHNVEEWAPHTILAKTYMPEKIQKWLRYIDSFMIFPIWVFLKTKTLPTNTLYVLIDQALGIWMPLLKNKNHVVHCHDFIALKSAMGDIKENPTSWTGKQYQSLIFNGFSKAENFICISNKTKQDLLHFLNKRPRKIEQVYNAIDPLFKTGSIINARKCITNFLNLDVKKGYLLHVGGNGFYKNRTGVIALYTAWRKQTNSPLPLLMIGYEPSLEIRKTYNASPYKENIHFLVGIENDLLLKAYQGANLFMFPSLTEGFGWPIAEAMASGCPVITTDAAPMNEVGGTAAVYIKRCPAPDKILTWANESAKVIETTLQLNEKERDTLILKGLERTKIFKEEAILNQIETFYKGITA
jgi:glycosyltransferase involved in cell wall biosynthesis